MSIDSVKLIESYVDRIQEIRGTRRGTPELSYRAALENLLNAIGSGLDPPVQATAELADTGAGHPDFGLLETQSGSLRCVVEAKQLEEETPNTADGHQVSRYWRQYGYVLVTNYRDFLLVVKHGENSARVEARYELAPDAESFMRTRPRALARAHAEGLTDFLIGVMRRAAPIGRPLDLAADLARHAREAKRRLDAHEITALAPLQQAMEESLGLHFTGKEGQAFFRSSLVQTLFYGLFSGWMLWRQDRHRARTFDWRDASEHLALPLIGDLYEEVARPKRLADLNLREPLEWATASLNNVDEAEFFKRFDAEHAITLFYEPFLQAFDPSLRKELGVWFTPPEIVQYMVARVEQVLRTELGIPDGLADEQVYVLDPATGTASYLIEVSKCIHRTLIEQGHGSLAGASVKKALCTRIFGFEILPAPYVVAHLQLGILLASMGTNLAPNQRVGVYLTNALTGWEPPKGAKQTLAFQFLKDEQEAANRVKQTAPILVILGNPPYYGFAGVAEEEEADLIEPYKAGLYEKWGVRKQLLDDLYIRFFRLAEKRIAEVGSRGVVCYITNYSWLDGLSHPVMRERLLNGFDLIVVDNCNGDRYKTGKRTPDGKPDQSMFTTDEHPVGIQPGTAITTLVKRRRVADPLQATSHVAEARYRDLWGTGNFKRSMLLKSKDDNPRESPQYMTIQPRATMRWVLINGAIGTPSAYDSWPLIPEILPKYVSGLVTRRDEFVTDIDRDVLVKRLRRYFDPSVPDSDIAAEFPRAMEDGSGFQATPARRTLLRKGFDPKRVQPFYYRPFDVRWLYYEPDEGLVNAASPRFLEYSRVMGVALELRQKIPTLKWDRGFVASTLADSFGNGCSVYFTDQYVETSLQGPHVLPNIDPGILSKACAACRVRICEKDGETYSEGAIAVSQSVFYHILAVLWSPEYRRQHQGVLRQDWPRVPLPGDGKLLRASAELGRSIAALLLPDKPVTGVTTGRLRPELRTLGVPLKVGGGVIEEPDDTIVDAGWGFRGQKNAVMCGKGLVTPHKGKAGGALDVYINDKVCWSNVPLDVWDMTIGGYPVVKKWLSYREYKVIGRALRSEELTHMTEVIRRLKAILLLGRRLDSNYHAVAGAEQLSDRAAS